MRERGITLMEVLVVIGMIAILLAIAFPAFNRWRVKASIEGDVRDIYAVIQKARAMAFTQKQDLTVGIVGNSVCISRGAVQIECLPLSNPFTGSVEITRRGYFSGTGTIRYNGNAKVNPSYDCLVVSVNRVRMGVWDEVSNECRAK
jgi:type IV fimbrial biogenesis protein FimT